MHLIDIPHFREVIIMATTCDYCGYRTNEVKSGGAITPTGKKISLKIINRRRNSKKFPFCRFRRRTGLVEGIFCFVNIAGRNLLFCKY